MSLPRLSCTLSPCAARAANPNRIAAPVTRPSTAIVHHALHDGKNRFDTRHSVRLLPQMSPRVADQKHGRMILLRSDTRPQLAERKLQILFRASQKDPSRTRFEALR